MKLADLGVRQRLLVGFAVLLVLLGLEFAFTVGLFRRIDALQDEISEDIDPRAGAASALERAILQRAVALRNYALTREPRYLLAEAESAERARSAIHDIDALSRRPEGRAIVEQLKPAAEAHARAGDRFLEGVEKASRAEQLAVAERDVAAARARVLELTRRFSEYQRTKLEATTSRLSAARRRMSWGLPCLALLMLATIGLTALVVARAVANPVRQLLAAARSLSKGDYRRAMALDPDAAAGKPAHPHANELRELSAAVADAAARLQRREAALAADVRLSSVLSSSLAIDQLADDALRLVASHVRAEAGAIYLLEDASSSLQRIAAFGLEPGAPPLALGEGIPGQAASQKSSIHVQHVPPDSLLGLELGGDTAPPRGVLAVPVLHRHRARAVILLTTLRGFADRDVRFVEHGANLLAPALENAVAHRDVVRFRTELQEKNEELAARNADLQAQREEIRAQRDELQRQGEQLREAAAARAQADRRKDEFLATLGHELRNPLAAIDHAVRVLERRSPAAASAQVAVISRQRRQLARLMDDLLDVSRISHGKLQLRKLPVDMGQIVRQAAESLRAFIEARQHELSLHVGEGSLAVDGDAARLEQVVCNLLHNAAKFTPEGGKLSVAIDREEDRVLLRVNDTGVGIDRELLPQIFDLFTQGEDSPFRREGLGVGLSLVRGLVEMHGGRVRATSAGPRRGSEFVVSLPLLTAPEELAGTPAASTPAARPPSRPLRVLVVDDDQDVASSLAELLRDWGHEVDVEHTAKGALETASRSAPDVVLLDIGLPDENGYEAARRIRRRLGPFSRTRMIALTGHGREEDRQSAADAGFDRYVLKASLGDELELALTEVADSAIGSAQG
jgi:signal transduction histidine kinase/ActR/RegA family two-component response regulator/CHASE3 domain sensor protein